MPIVLPFPLSTQEIRVLQEFRRVGAESLTLEAAKAIKHPAGGGEAPVLSLIEKGYLAADDTKQNVALTAKSKELLAIDYKPLEAEADAAAGSAEA